MESLKSLLTYDPLQEAENITGLDSAASKGTAFLGMVLMMEKGSKLKLLQESVSDTTFSMPMQGYIDNVVEFGFEIVYQSNFAGKYGEESHFILFHPKYSILMNVDSFMGDRNECKCFFNFVPNEQDYFDGNLSHVGLNGILSCYDSFDGRESLRYKIQSCAKFGEFKLKWDRMPFLWLLNHVDTKGEGYDYRAINKERLALLPSYVREIIGEYN